MNQDALPGSTILPAEALADPAAAVAREMGVDKEDISVVSVETIDKDQVKIRFYIV